jgi:hypothetical protein
MRTWRWRKAVAALLRANGWAHLRAGKGSRDSNGTGD